MDIIKGMQELFGCSASDAQQLLAGIMTVLTMMALTATGLTIIRLALNVLEKLADMIKGAGDAIVGWAQTLGRGFVRAIKELSQMVSEYNAKQNESRVARFHLFTWKNGFVSLKLYKGQDMGEDLIKFLTKFMAPAATEQSEAPIDKLD